MRIAIMGAGGIGAYVGARLAAIGEDVAFIARGGHLAAMRSSGLAIRSPEGDLDLTSVVATDKPVEIGPVDLVLFTVKLWDTEAAARATAPLIAPHTRVLTLQNGIDSIDLISRFVSRDRVVGGVIYVAASVDCPGVIRHTGGARRVVVDDAGGNTVIRDLREVCRGATGIELETTSTIGPVIWEKFIKFAAFAAATSLMRTTAGPLLASPEACAFLRQLLDEGTAIAAVTGNAVAGGFSDAAMAMYASMPPTTCSSMAGDLERGRRLELEWVSGRIHALGLKYGIPTPAHTAAYRGLILYANGARVVAPSSVGAVAG